MHQYNTYSSENGSYYKIHYTPFRYASTANFQPFYSHENNFNQSNMENVNFDNLLHFSDVNLEPQNTDSYRYFQPYHEIYGNQSQYALLSTARQSLHHDAVTYNNPYLHSSQPINSEDSNSVSSTCGELPTRRTVGFNEGEIEFVNNGYGIRNPVATDEDLRLEKNTDMTNGAEKCFRCRKCNKTYLTKSFLRRHMREHLTIKRYLCVICMKGFNDKYALKRHTRTHTGVKPFRCDKCEKNFTQRSSLEIHCSKVHGTEHRYGYKEKRSKIYVCEDCAHTTDRSEAHYLHIREKHPGNPVLSMFTDKRCFQLRKPGNNLKEPKLC